MARGRGHVCGALAAMAALVGACQGDEGDDAGAGSTTSIVDFEAFVPVFDAADPFAARRPADAVCTPDGYVSEDFGGEPSFEVFSGFCNYLSVSQALPVGLPAGATLRIRLWHFELTSVTPAQAYVAVALGGAEAWSTTIPIPSASGLVLEEWALAAAVPAGAPLVFHVDNHGANSYALLEISARW